MEDVEGIEGDNSFPTSKEFVQDFEIAPWQGGKLSMPNVKFLSAIFTFVRRNFAILRKME